MACGYLVRGCLSERCSTSSAGRTLRNNAAPSCLPLRPRVRSLARNPGRGGRASARALICGGVRGCLGSGGRSASPDAALKKEQAASSGHKAGSGRADFRVGVGKPDQRLEVCHGMVPWYQWMGPFTWRGSGWRAGWAGFEGARSFLWDSSALLWRVCDMGGVGWCPWRLRKAAGSHSGAIAGGYRVPVGGARRVTQNTRNTRNPG